MIDQWKQNRKRFCLRAQRSRFPRICPQQIRIPSSPPPSLERSSIKRRVGHTPTSSDLGHFPTPRTIHGSTQSTTANLDSGCPLQVSRYRGCRRGTEPPLSTPIRFFSIARIIVSRQISISTRLRFISHAILKRRECFFFSLLSLPPENFSIFRS